MFQSDRLMNIIAIFVRDKLYHHVKLAEGRYLSSRERRAAEKGERLSSP